MNKTMVMTMELRFTGICLSHPLYESRGRSDTAENC
jgi:hypothetical protein